ncbi:MAG: hemolysin family protein [Ardenticatenaceae bacterium]|nr:hemolysin family protein [Ardenticatenaceae bacterium]HBY94146.1 HlyC/CorC family transporter [Chloroflexota bacterium]
MINQVLIEILVIFALILANGFFAGAEMALVSVRRPRLEAAAEEGDHRAALVLQLLEHSGDFLATVQVGITLIGTFAAAFGGATVAKALVTWLLALPLPLTLATADSLALLIVVALITYLSLVFGELVPKQLALRNAETTARRVAGPLARLARAAQPIIRFLSFSTTLVLTVFGTQEKGGPSVTPEEIEALIRRGAAEGLFEAGEQQLVSEALHFGERTVRQIMTPRRDVVALALNAAPEEILAILQANSFSRYPAYQEGLDDASGFVHVKDILTQSLSGEPLELAPLVRPALLIPEGISVADLLPRFQAERTHLAIVFDEFGSTSGLVTLEDVLEELVGDIVDEYQVYEVPITARGDGAWLVDGSIVLNDLDEFLERELGIELEWPERNELSYDTLAGFLLVALGHIPEVGETAVWGSLLFEVVDMDGRRVDKVLLRQESADAPPDPSP